MAQRQGTNGLGVAGFVVSLVGFVACGLLSPIGLLLSAIGMFKEPRGLAIAGFVLGLLGSVGWIALIVFVGLGAVMAAVGLAAAVGPVEAAADGIRIEQAIDGYVQRTGAPPADLSALSLEAETLVDFWGNPYRYTVTPVGGYTLTSDGPDGVSGTADDIDLGSARTSP